jgi:hypothetical protein
MAIAYQNSIGNPIQSALDADCSQLMNNAEWYGSDSALWIVWRGNGTHPRRCFWSLGSPNRTSINWLNDGSSETAGWFPCCVSEVRRSKSLRILGVKSLVHRCYWHKDTCHLSKELHTGGRNSTSKNYLHGLLDNVTLNMEPPIGNLRSFTGPKPKGRSN